ncbi:MAG: GFA family protein [Myxococcales bacterium]|nr:GFA family protein [Myxococcales bacterium]
MAERVVFPQPGGCICGDVRYALREDPITLYVCHCTDCQSESGASFTLSMILGEGMLEVVRGEPLEYTLQLPDGRRKGSSYCGRCMTRLYGPSKRRGLTLLSPGTLDDTSWLHPAGHIWTRSAQPWIDVPSDTLRFEQQPDEEGSLELARRWKARV